jgi:predicted lactoylglutathione lyase
MIGYVTLGTNDLAKAVAFYDELFASIGAGRFLETDKVDAFYTKALELGAVCEGKPGPRGLDGFYAGYFRDLDGNKLNAFYFDMKSQ